jgi:hypothetical protein
MVVEKAAAGRERRRENAAGMTERAFAPSNTVCQIHKGETKRLRRMETKIA